jgi:hypothetical protein
MQQWPIIILDAETKSVLEFHAIITIAAATEPNRIDTNTG